jgi:hypothetical protein
MARPLSKEFEEFKKLGRARLPDDHYASPGTAALKRDFVVLGQCAGRAVVHGVPIAPDVVRCYWAYPILAMNNGAR